jgi:hypothetical protein
LHPTDYATLQNAKANYPGAKIVVISYSARPLVLDNIIDDVDAFVQVWWPGTEGLGMTDVLFGDYDFTGKTAFPWYWFPEWLGFNDDPGKPYMFDIGAGLKKGEEFNDATPLPVRPSGDLRQGDPIRVGPSGTTIDGRIYTWNARAPHGPTNPNFDAEPFRPTYIQPVYGKSGLMASTQITLPTAANWCGDTWVEYKINVLRAGDYDVSFTRGNTNATTADAVKVLIDGVEKASYSPVGMTTAQSVALDAGIHILRVAFASSAANFTVNTIRIAASGTTSFAIDADTLVAGFDANINISGAGTATRAELRRGFGDAAVIANTDLTAGAGRLSVAKADATAGDYYVMIYEGDQFVGSQDVSIVPLPDNVWSIRVETESNMIKAYFNTTISLDTDKFDVVLNGVSVGGTLEGDGRSINFSDVNASNYVGGEEAVITGIKLPDLFPDYVFTYRGQLQKK